MYKKAILLICALFFTEISVAQTTGVINFDPAKQAPQELDFVGPLGLDFPHSFVLNLGFFDNFPGFEREIRKDFLSINSPVEINDDLLTKAIAAFEERNAEGGVLIQPVELIASDIWRVISGKIEAPAIEFQFTIKPTHVDTYKNKIFVSFGEGGDGRQFCRSGAEVGYELVITAATFTQSSHLQDKLRQIFVGKTINLKPVKVQVTHGHLFGNNKEDSEKFAADCRAGGLG